jgi:heat shock protein HslJ
MKALISVLVLCVAVGLLVAGCVTPVPVTPAPTTTATPRSTPTTSVTDPALAGSWTLRELGLQGGQAPLTVFPQPITIIITLSEPGILAGNGGCNNYGGTYTLTGTSGPFGKTIIMGPIASNMKYCIDSSDIENSYFQILSNVNSYGIDNNTTLSMRDPLGSTLVYQRI